MTSRTLRLRHHGPDFLADVVGLGLTVTALQTRNDALKSMIHMGNTTALTGVGVLQLPSSRSVDQFLLEILRQLLVRPGDVCVVVNGQLLQHLPIESHGVHRGKNIPHRAFHQALVLIRHQGFRFNPQSKTQSGASLTGPVRRIKRKHPRLHLLDADAVFRAGQHRAEGLLIFLSASVLLGFGKKNVHQSFPFPNGQLYRLRNTTPVVFFHHYPVDGNFDSMLLVLL